MNGGAAVGASAARPRVAGGFARAAGRARVPLGSVGLLLLGVAIWQLASTLTFVVPSVGETADAMVSNLSSAEYRSDLLYTVRNIGLAFVVGITVGASLGMLLGYFAWLRRGLEPFLLALYSVPKIILYPLILPILKIGAASQVTMGSLHAFFPMMIMVAGAVAGMPGIYRRLGRALGASPIQMLWRVTLPAIRRSFLTGMRLAVSLATIGVIMAEFFITEQGVGRIMKNSYNFAQYEVLLSTVLLLLALSFAFSFLIWSIERRLPE